MKPDVNPATLSEPSGFLNYFTQTPILRQIGHRRLAMLLNPFDQDLKAGGLVLPEPDRQDDDYFADLANALSIAERLPGRLRQTLLTIELAASPENEMPLWRAIHRRIPGVSVSQDCPLDRALELWFLAPEEFTAFQTNLEEVQPPMNTDEHEFGVGHVDGDFSPRLEPSSASFIRVDPCPHVAPKSLVAPEPSGGGDEGGSVVERLSDSSPPNETDDQTYDRLARLSPGEYDRARQPEAARLGIRKETLDTEVARRRPLSDDAQGRAVHLPAVEPWPEPVNGAEVLDQVSARFTHYLVLPPGAADAIALWQPHAHACTAFVHTPRLNLSSPEPGCGKTTTLDLIATMTPRPLRTENLTAPVLFRLVDQHQPTLLLDEVDSYLTQADELRGLLNAGHKRGACAYRCEGESNAVRAFKAFAPAVLSGIGDLPGTLRDRSITIVLLPAEADELESRFDSLHTEIESVLCRKLARWTQDHFAILQACNPPMPPSAYNRLADNWRPLFAIAQTVGGDWPRRALEAFNHLTAECVEHKAIDSQLLLADIRQVFAQSGATRIPSKQLVEALCALPNGHYSVLCAPQSGVNWLSRLLHPFGISPRTMRIGGRCTRGYDLGDFTGTFARLLKDGSQSNAL